LTGLVLGTELTPEQRDYLEDVRQAAQKLLKLFNRLIELMELESYAPVQGPVGLRSLLEVALQSCAPPASAKGLSLASSIAADLPDTVWSDLNLLRMALLELVDNAVRFTTEGEVSIAMSRVEEGEGEKLCIAVRDTGMGIPAERLADISTGLTQADSHLNKRFAGLGVGMAKAHKATALLGGHLEVESAPGSGSTFRILLPLLRDAAAPETPLDGVPPPAA
jgi:signal transduction histidine kinase